MHGTSFAYTFDHADAAERHTQQYFETWGNRAIYKDGCGPAPGSLHPLGRHGPHRGPIRARHLPGACS